MTLILWSEEEVSTSNSIIEKFFDLLLDNNLRYIHGRKRYGEEVKTRRILNGHDNFIKKSPGVFLEVKLLNNLPEYSESYINMSTDSK